jgi:hypothetical protein
VTAVKTFSIVKKNPAGLKPPEGSVFNSSSGYNFSATLFACVNSSR